MLEKPLQEALKKMKRIYHTCLEETAGSQSSSHGTNAVACSLFYGEG